MRIPAFLEFLLNDYYEGISGAETMENTACAYRASDPDTTHPGWTLVLPGVSPNIRLSHAGTPAP